MLDSYGSHADFMKHVEDDAAERAAKMEKALKDAFKKIIHKEEVEVISFADMTAFELAKGIEKHPIILKPLLAACNIAARAIERDLHIKNLNTYNPRFKKGEAEVIAGYIKPFLPALLPVPTLCTIDRTAFIDKEIRKRKGQWEKLIVRALNDISRRPFTKRKFKIGEQDFELDAASPRGGDIEFAVDIKRIEARRDIHKRSDEIVNKASKLKTRFPRAKFGAVVYYPFIAEHSNVQDRLSSPNIDSVVFASESEESIETAVKMLLSKMGIVWQK